MLTADVFQLFIKYPLGKPLESKLLKEPTYPQLMFSGVQYVCGLGLSDVTTRMRSTSWRAVVIHDTHLQMRIHLYMYTDNVTNC